MKNYKITAVTSGKKVIGFIQTDREIEAIKMFIGKLEADASTESLHNSIDSIQIELDDNIYLN